MADNWVQVAGQLEGQTNNPSITVFNDELYVGTSPSAMLFKWDGEDGFIKVADTPPFTPPFPTWGMFDLVEYHGELYGASFIGGHLWKWNGSNAWILVAQAVGVFAVNDLVVFNDKIYGCTYSNGALLEWNGVNAWIQKAPKKDRQSYVQSLCVFNDELYAGTYRDGTNPGRLFKWNGTDAWVELAGQYSEENGIMSLCVHHGKLYGSTHKHGFLLEWNGSAWEKVADTLENQATVTHLLEYRNGLYIGTNNGMLFKWNGIDSWIKVVSQYNEESCVQITEFNDKIYATTSGGILLEWSGPEEEPEPEPAPEPIRRFLGRTVLGEEGYKTDAGTLCSDKTNASVLGIGNDPKLIGKLIDEDFSFGIGGGLP